MLKFQRSKVTFPFPKENSDSYPYPFNSIEEFVKNLVVFDNTTTTIDLGISLKAKQSEEYAFYEMYPKKFGDYSLIIQQIETGRKDVEIDMTMLYIVPSNELINFFAWLGKTNSLEYDDVSGIN